MPFKRSPRTYDEHSLYEYAVGALGRRMRSVAELKRLMRQRLLGVEPSRAEKMMDLVLFRLKDHGYLNDTKFAAAYTANRRDNERFGRMRVVTDLKAKGVHSELIQQAVESAYAGVDEEKLAREHLARKRVKRPGNEKEAARVYRLLARAGFRTSVAVRILKAWNVDDEVLTALESESEAASES